MFFFFICSCVCLLCESSQAQTDGQYSVIAGGKQNKILAEYAFIGGGENNFIDAAGDYSVIPNGKNVYINGSHSWAMGKNISVAADNVFFWGYQDDNTTATNGALTVTQPNTFILYHTPNPSAPEGEIKPVRMGIGTIDPLFTLDVIGTTAATTVIITAPQDIETGTQLYIDTSTGKIGLDLAELFTTTEPVDPGDVLVIDPNDETLLLKKSREPYDQKVVGIVSSAPALIFEENRIISDFSLTEQTQRPPVALSGQVPCKVSLENGAIAPGDLLTTSSTPGHAMKADLSERAFGTIVGKALEAFNSTEQKTGMITVFVGLQ